MTDMMDYRKYIDKGEREVLKKMPLMLTVYLAEKGRFFPVLISDILCRFLNDTEDNIIVNFSEDRKSNVHPEDYKKLMYIVLRNIGFDIIYRSTVEQICARDSNNSA